MKVSSGKTRCAASVGILMLDSRFPRICGDVGNATTWPFPVRYKIVRGATPDLVVRHRAEGLQDAFIEAARELVADGCNGLATTCGFLSLFQRDLAKAAGVPVVASSLMQVAMVNRMLPVDKCCGVLTISASALTQEHLAAAGVPPHTPIGTTEGGREFTRVILGDEQKLNVEAARLDNVEAACALADAHPNLGALVLECTNMTPYARDMSDATGLPVYSMVSLVNWFQAGLVPKKF